MSSYYVDLLIRNILVEQTEHHDVLVKGYVDQVVISCGSEVIARHPRSYQRDDFVFDPVHYLPLLEQKTGGPGPGRSAAGVGPARGVRRAAPPAGVPHGTKGQAGVRPGAPVAGKLQGGRGARRSAGLPTRSCPMS